MTEKKTTTRKPPNKPAGEPVKAGIAANFEFDVVKVLAELRIAAGVSQDKAGSAMGFGESAKPRDAISAWERGLYQPADARRGLFMGYLWDTLKLKENPTRFCEVWRDVAHGQWHWPELDDVLLREGFTKEIPEALRRAVAASSRSALVEPDPPESVPRGNKFVGRKAEIAHYSDSLRQQGVAVLTGMAGVGKTSLASHLARIFATDDQTFWHTCVRDDDVNALLWRLAGFLYWRKQPEVWRLIQSARGVTGTRTASESYLELCLKTLSGRDFALCFDDAQWISEDRACDLLISRLSELAGRNRLKLIVAGRRAPACLDPFEPDTLYGLTERDSQQLLAPELGNLPPDLRLRLHEQTEGNPHLLTLAIAALKRAKNPAGLIDQIAAAQFVHDFLLREVDADLTDEQRAAMRALTVLESAASVRAVEAVAAGPMRKALEELYARNLLKRGGGFQQFKETAELLHGQFKQHALVQQFYAERAELTERNAMHHRAAEHYERTERDALRACDHYVKAGEHGAAIRLLTADIWEPIYSGQTGRLRSLLTALAGAAQEPAGAAQVNLALGQAHAFNREVLPARACFETAYVAARDLPEGRETSLLKARACRGIAELLRSTEPREALDWVDRGLAELARYPAAPAPDVPLKIVQPAASDVDREVAALYAEGGFARINMADFGGAIQMLNEGLARLPENDPRRTAVLINLGVAYCTQGKTEAGMEKYAAALKLAEQTGDLWRVVSIRHNIGIERELAGNWDAAAREYAAALALAERIGSVTPQTGITLALGILATKQGHLTQGERYLRAAVDMAQRYELGRHQVAGLSSLADTLLRKGELTEAADLLGKAQALAEHLDAGDQLAEIERNWAALRLAQGEYEPALAACERSLALARQLELPAEEGMTLRVQGETLAAQGKLDAARAAFEAGATLLEGNDAYEAARTREAWARVLASQEQSQASER